MNASNPLKPAVFHILLALADRDSHGYAVMPVSYTHLTLPTILRV